MFGTQRFHQSVYVTLGMACAALGYAELAFLPEISFLSVLVAILLFVAYRLEGRWALSLGAANVLGGLIGVGAILWVVYQFFRPWGGTLLDQLPWPTSLLPYLGPLLMILIPAKLFRPKHNGDVWGLQGIGLIAVALGCALAGDPVFGVLLIGYVVCLVWSLTLFYFHRAQQDAGSVGGGTRWSEPPRTLGQSLRWATFVTGCALLVFLATPRSGDARWQVIVNGGRMQTGYPDERPGIDLNNSGTLSLNREVAYSVRVTEADGTPKLGLSPAIRWRGTTFNYYESGRWEDRPAHNEWNPLSRGQSFASSPSTDMHAQLPYLGPRQLTVQYFPTNRIANPTFLAEPTWHKLVPRTERRSIPVISIFEVRPRERPLQVAWNFTSDYELRPPAPPGGVQRMSYLQVMLPPAEAGLGPEVGVTEMYLEHMRNYTSVPRLRNWTSKLAQRLADRQLLPAAALGDGERDDARRIAPQYYESVARALEAHLAGSGDFKYSLTLQRQDPQLDPVEDFLYTTRKGHCNRFSTALTLMLRSIGIPARIVLGFRGVDEVGDGLYEVRQAYAHSWVEALVVRRKPGAEPTWHWLTLDPTPAAGNDDDGETGWGRWWEDSRLAFATMFKHFIVEYDADQQDRTRSSLGETVWAGIRNGGVILLTFVSEGPARFVLLVAILTTIVCWRQLRRWRLWQSATPPDAATSFLDRLFALLGRFTRGGILGRTPREFAAEATSQIRAVPAVVAFADLPMNAVDAFYRIRYGRQQIDATEQAQLGTSIEQFQKALPADTDATNESNGVS